MKIPFFNISGNIPKSVIIKLSLLFIICGSLWAQESTKGTTQVTAQKNQATESTPDNKPVQKTVEEQRLATLRFGTETEIANLIQTLKNEKVSNLDNELIEIANNTRNRNILTGIFAFFGETEKKGLEKRAIKAITDRKSTRLNSSH